MKNKIYDIIIILILIGGTAYLYFGFIKTKPIPSKSLREEIGLVVPLSTKKFTEIGQAVLIGSQLAVSKIAKANPDEARPLMTNTIDSYCNYDMARSKVADFIRDSKTHYIITGGCARDLYTMADLAGDYDKIIFSLESAAGLDETDEAIDPKDKSNILNFYRPYKAVSDEVGRYISDETKYKRVAILSHDSGYGKFWREKFKQSLTEQGLEVAVDISFVPSDFDNLAHSSLLHETKTQLVVLIASQTEDVITTINSLSRVDETPVLVFDHDLSEVTLETLSPMIQVHVKQGLSKINESVLMDWQAKYPLSNHGDIVVASAAMVDLIEVLRRDGKTGLNGIEQLHQTITPVNGNNIQFDDNNNLIWSIEIAKIN